MFVEVFSGEECLWRGPAEDSVMGVRPGDRLHLPDESGLYVLARDVSLGLCWSGDEARLSLRLTVSRTP